jgi:probable phosphoglycerate mutase
MTPIALIRHAPTEWNEAKRLQGHTDQPLSEAGRAAAAGWRLPAELAHFLWYASPLSRAAETARLLGLACATEPAVIEMHWGAWEGHTLDELKTKYGKDTVTGRTKLGIDFRPHDGESPREVRVRVHAWLKRRAVDGVPAGAVTHLGVIRAMLSLATGWDMIGPPPAVINPATAHLFAVDRSGEVRVERLNISLT